RSASMTACMSRLPRPYEGELLQSFVRVDARTPAASRPHSVAVEGPGQPVVGEVDPDDLVEAARERRVLDLDEHLDATVEVARHQVGRTDEVQRATGSTAVAEHVDARVLEEAADDR